MHVTCDVVGCVHLSEISSDVSQLFDACCLGWNESSSKEQWQINADGEIKREADGTKENEHISEAIFKCAAKKARNIQIPERLYFSCQLWSVSNSVIFHFCSLALLSRAACLDARFAEMAFCFLWTCAGSLRRPRTTGPSRWRSSGQRDSEPFYSLFCYCVAL